MIGDNKSWLDATPSKTAFIFGLAVGVGTSALIGFVLLLTIFLRGGIVKANTQVAAVAPSAAAAAAQQPPAPTGPVDIKLTAADHTIGPKNAKVTVVEFSDFQCPYCGRFEPTVQQMLKEYKDKIQFVYRNFPLDSLHPNARPAAIAAECGAEQGKFFEFHDQIIAKQDQLSDAYYQEIAKNLGLNITKFNDCLKSDRPGTKVEADYQSGIAVGVQGTPSTFVNGVAVSGAQPYSVVKAAIDAALK